MERHSLATPAPAAEGDPQEIAAFLHDPAGCLSALQARYGDAVHFRSGAGSTVFVFAPEYNRQVFGAPETFGIVSRFPGPKNSPQRRLGHGLFSMNGEEHLQNRRLLMPPFKKSVLDRYHRPLIELVDERLMHWRTGTEIDLIEQMKELTLTMATRLLFGVELDEHARAVEEHFNAWLDANHEVSFAAQLPVEPSPHSYERMLDAAAGLEAAVQRMIAGRRNWERARDVLAILLQARAAGRIGDLEVLGQVVAIYNAAYHTTTYALTWTLFLLAQHADVLHDVAQHDFAPLDGRPPTPQDLNAMPRLERAIRESLRLLPPVVFLPRLATEDVAFAGLDLPAGSMVLLSPYATHRRADLFPDPKRYAPERWHRAASPYAYFPFGGGYRLCLGASFSQNLLKIALPMILQRFRLQVVPGAAIDRHGTLTLGARHGVPVQLHPPDRNFHASPVTGSIHEMVEISPSEAKAAASPAA